MRTGKIEVNGKEYLLCFSARVVRDCSERYGNVDKIPDALKDGTETEIMDECFWLMERMMDAGARYAKLEGTENPAPLSADVLYDVCDFADLAKMKTSIFETITNGNERAIDAEFENEKNREATQQA